VHVGVARPGVYLAQLELLARATSQAVAAIERTGGEVADALAGDVRARPLRRVVLSDRYLAEMS